VFAFDLFIVFIVFFVFILVPRHKSRESVKIGPHPRGHPSSRRHPAGRGVSSAAFAHHVLLRKMLDAHLRLAHGGYAGGQRCAGLATMVAAAEARNW
jgi:hypothetical protein